MVLRVAAVLSLVVVFTSTLFTQSGDEQTIRSADREWSSSAKISSLDKFLSFYADDGPRAGNHWCQVLTWQELSDGLSSEVRQFLKDKSMALRPMASDRES